MQWENRFDLLPVAMFRRDASSSFFLGACNQMVDDTISFSLRERFTCEKALGLSIWLGCSDAIKPIFDPITLSVNCR